MLICITMNACVLIIKFSTHMSAFLNDSLIKRIIKKNKTDVVVNQGEINF